MSTKPAEIKDVDEELPAVDAVATPNEASEEPAVGRGWAEVGEAGDLAVAEGKRFMRVLVILWRGKVEVEVVM